MSAEIFALDGTGDAVFPVLVLGYETSRESQNIVHTLIGGGVAVTLIRPNPRSGTLELFFLNETTARTALDLLSRETSYLVSDVDTDILQMEFVVSGSIGAALDADTRKRWVVSVGYQEVD